MKPAVCPHCGKPLPKPPRGNPPASPRRRPSGPRSCRRSRRSARAGSPVCRASRASWPGAASRRRPAALGRRRASRTCCSSVRAEAGAAPAGHARPGRCDWTAHLGGGGRARADDVGVSPEQSRHPGRCGGGPLLHADQEPARDRHAPAWGTGRPRSDPTANAPRCPCGGP
jgi:hypothetical protein